MICDTAIEETLDLNGWNHYSYSAVDFHVGQKHPGWLLR